jgi:hypothetical protein
LASQFTAGEEPGFSVMGTFCKQEQLVVYRLLARGQWLRWLYRLCQALGYEIFLKIMYRLIKIPP